MKRRSSTASARRNNLRIKFVSETIAELKKVTWLRWPQEVMYLTTLVLIVTVIVGLILGLIDYGFTKLVNDLLLAG